MSDQYHTLIFYTGYVETTSVCCFQFHCQRGFDTPKEIIEDFVLCALLAQYHLLVNEQKLADKNIKSVQEFLELLKTESSIRDSLFDDFFDWHKLMSNEFNIWDGLDQNYWSPWGYPRVKEGKFVEVEAFENFIENCFVENDDEYHTINWDDMNIVVGSYKIED